MRLIGQPNMYVATITVKGVIVNAFEVPARNHEIAQNYAVKKLQELNIKDYVMNIKRV